MPIRIFKLAKELKIESKAVVDACQKLGIRDGVNIVPLTALTTEEARQVEDYLRKHDLASQAPASKIPFEEPDAASTPLPPPKPHAPTTGKVRVIQPARGFITEVDPNKPVAPVLPAAPVAPVPTVAQVEPVSTPVAEPAKQDAKEPEAPVSAPVAETKPEPAPEADKSEPKSESKPESAPEPVAEPAVSAPVAQEKPAEPEAVKPETGAPAAAETAPATAAPAETAHAPEKVAVEPEPAKEPEQKPETQAAVETPVASATPVAPAPEVKPVAEVKPEPATPATPAPQTASVAPVSAPAASADAQKQRQDSGSQNQQHKPSLRETLQRNAGNNRDRGQRGGRDGRDSRDGRDQRGRNNSRQPEPRVQRPAPIVSSFISQLESTAQSMGEMRRPPALSQNNDRVRVLGQPSKPKKETATGAASGDAPQKPAAPKASPIALHLAPMPSQPAKPAKQTEKEPAAQKPAKRLSPEALRAAAAGAGPLAEHIRKSAERTAQGGGNRQNRTGATGAGASAQRTGARTGSGVGAGRDIRSSEPAGYGDSRDSGRGGKRKQGGDRDGARREDKRNQPARRGGDIRNKLRGEDDYVDYRAGRRAGGKKGRDKGASAAVTAPRKNDVVIEVPCTPKQFAETTGFPVAVVIKKLMELGYMFNLNHPLDSEVLQLLIIALDIKATVKEQATLEELYVDTVADYVDPPESLVPRAPVVTFLGHVDHGKTSLLDRILNLHVVSGEKGGITQHIRAYRVDTPGGPVTFVDTPGHEAFTEMRKRGANCTDIAVLVVAADDGVMPQTEEAISHAKAAGVPIVVALNKMDLPDVNRDRVIQELANNDVMPAEWGGDVEIVETSAVTGMGVDTLLQTLLMVAELNELKANPDRPATGVVLEASLQSGEGVVCKALVQKGTLRNGDVVLCGSSYGRVRAMTDTLDAHKRIKEAGPSVPVSLSGLDTPPEAGSRFVVLEDVSVAREIAEERAKRAREIELAGNVGHVTLENFFERLNSAKTQKTLNVIVRADVRGSIEAIRKELGKLEHPEVKVRILQALVGGITEADVHLADASDAIIVGFNVVPDEGARTLAEANKIQIRRYDVIYKLTDDVKSALEGMLKPIEQVKELGRALVQRAFNISRVGVIAGCRVTAGVIERDCQIRVIRNSRIIGEYALDTLKREKDDAKEVREGYECGIKLKNFNDVKEGDILEAYKIEEIARTFD